MGKTYSMNGEMRNTDFGQKTSIKETTYDA
jgi:hypothetical protein